uniref:Uncharacterized protein n=1 Tax=Anguilla anguilla TaxID=7936 RepID=A0A0E9S018_ANGAN
MCANWNFFVAHLLIWDALYFFQLRKHAILGKKH